MIFEPKILIIVGNQCFNVFINTGLIASFSGISHRSLIICRWSASVISLALIGPLLHSYDVRSTLLPWIPAVTVVYIGLIVAMTQKSKVTNFF